MVVRGSLFIAAFSLVAAVAWAEPSVRASVDHTTVTVNMPFALRIEVSGRQPERPTLPEVEGLQIRSAPIGSSQQMSLVNGVLSFSVTWTYRAVAVRPGPVTIPPIVVGVDGKELSTAPIQLAVVQGRRIVQPPTDTSDDISANEAATVAPDQAPTPEDAVLITTEVDKRTVYEGEPVQLTLTNWILESVQAGPSGDPGQNYPETEGFYATELEPRQGRKVRNGWDYRVLQLSQVLYPTRSGELTIGPWNWEGQALLSLAGGRRMWRKYSLSTDPIPITVKPLPQRPANFSGAVGTFSVRANLAGKERAQAGVPLKLEVQVSGNGNPDFIGEPKMPKIQGANVQTAESEPQSGDSASLPITKNFVYTVSPLAPGTLVIPEIEFCYFDPISESYKTEKAGPFEISVRPSTEKGQNLIAANSAPEEAGAVRVIGRDILPNITDPGALRPYRPSTARTAAVAVAPVLAYAGVAAFMARRRRFEQDAGYARAYFAKSKAHKHLHQVACAAEPADELYRAVIGFVADKFDVGEAGLTSADLQRLLESHDVDADLTENLLKIACACERARYASAKLTADEITALSNAASVSMDKLDALLGAPASLPAAQKAKESRA